MERAYRADAVSRRSGVFVLVAVLTVLVLLLLTARAQRWLTSSSAFTVRLPEAGSFGLRVGSSVELLGTVAGQVDDLRIDADGTMWASILVRADFAGFVCGDAACVIKKRTLDLAGDAYLEIARGSGPACEPGAVLHATAARDLTEAVTEVIQGLGRELTPTLSELRVAVREYGELARSLRDPTGGMQTTLGRIEALARRAEAGEGVLPRLLSDATWARNLDASLTGLGTLIQRLEATTTELGGEARETARSVRALASELRDGEHSLTAAVGDLRAVLAQLQPILADVARATAALPEITTTARDEMQALPELVLRSQQMLAEVEKLVLAAQRHWLLAPYVNHTGPSQRLGGEGLGERR